MSRFFGGSKKKYEEPSVSYSALQNKKRSSESDDEEERRGQQELLPKPSAKRQKNSVSDDDEEGQSSSQPSTSQASTSSQPSTSAGPSSASSEPIVANMTVTVSEIQKKGKPEEYVVVTIVEGVNEPFKVLRQYNEFQELERRLNKKFKETGYLVPDLPAEKTPGILVRFFKGFDSRISVNRCHSVTKYLREVVKSDRLRGDENVQEFLTNTDPFLMLTETDAGIFKIARDAVQMIQLVSAGDVADESKAFKEKHYFAGDFDACVRDLRAADAALRKARLTMAAENEELAHVFNNLGIIEKDSTAIRESFFALSKCIQEKVAIERKYFESGDDKISKAFESHINEMTELKKLYDVHKQIQLKWANATKWFKDCIKTNEDGDAFIFQEDVDKLNFKLQDVRAELDNVLKIIPLETERVKNISAKQLREELITFCHKYINVKKEIMEVHERYMKAIDDIYSVENTVPERMNRPLHRYH
ncbi:unnamed protein product [Caenorhabditis brenneri]